MRLENIIFHIDVNAAFLSWEAVYRLTHGVFTETDSQMPAGGYTAHRGGGPENRRLYSSSSVRSFCNSISACSARCRSFSFSCRASSFAFLSRSVLNANPMEEPELELACTVYNINAGMNRKLLSECPVLEQYIFLFLQSLFLRLPFAFRVDAFLRNGIFPFKLYAPVK